MPPRIPFFSGLRALNAAPSSTSQTCRTFTSTPVEQASTVAQKRRHRDPYALAQARARKAANVSRQQVLQEERNNALGDPVRGITTPFVQSFDTALPSNPSPQNTHSIGRDTNAASPQQSPPGPNANTDSHLNFYLSKQEVQAATSHSELLIAPIPRFTSVLGNEALAAEKAARDDKHATATEALARIASLANGSSKDRLRVNIQRCIETFGRHATDAHLAPKPALSDSMTPAPGHQLEKVPRAGPDTGSSEVQIAILTAKIRTLADFLETRGGTDKVNKRNLRVLVHKRQKLLSYLRRRERGGPRWQNLIETLGLTEGTWKGEISL